MAQDWAREEVEATVADYLEMLRQELSGVPYNKTDHRRNLARLLVRRSDGAIERKHQNISAIMLELGLPYIDGYKPSRNYQQLLFEIVEDVVGRANTILDSIGDDVMAPATRPHIKDILSAEIPAPELQVSTGTKNTAGFIHATHPHMVNYLALEASNRSLGKAGEEFILYFEKFRLRAAGAEGLAEQVEHISVTKGDSAGFDILSYEQDGSERLIEVKTTRYGVQTPFFVSPHEVAVSKKERERYHLYRVFDFKRTPRFFRKRGQIDHLFRLEPAQYKAIIT